MKFKKMKSDKVLIKKLSEDLDLPRFIAEILVNRGFKKEHEILDFILTEDKLSEPFGLPDMEKTCERLTRAILNKEQITICGDYDVDGTLATTILLRFLRTAGAKVNQFIPHRTLDGYGISDETMKFLQESYDTKVAISVDTGTTAFEAADEAKKRNIDLIVTDHHNLSEKGLPDVYALVNAKRLPDPNNNYLLLCGAGIAYYIIRALNIYWKKSGQSLHIGETDYSVLAMMATIADVMPLHKDNRAIVKYGLKNLPLSRIEGMNALFQELNIHQPVARDIAFRFAPIINAAGRLGSAQQALELFIETNKLQATLKAQELIALNNKRRKISESVNKEVLELADKKVQESNPPILVIAGNFHVGVIGISAAKVVDKYNRPAMVIGFDETGYGKASCRSIAGFNVKLALDYAKDFHLGGGGHDMAAGFSIDKGQLDNFEAKVIEYFNTHPPVGDKEIEIEAVLDYSEINANAIKLVELLEPLGKDNPAPIVEVLDCPVFEKREIKGGHLMFTLENDTKVMYFNPPQELKNSMPKTINVIGEITAYKNALKITAMSIKY